MQAKAYSLRDVQGFLDYCADANVKLVRAQYLKELHQQGRKWPRRQEAEVDKTSDGQSALLSHQELQEKMADGWVVNPGAVGRTHRFTVFALSHVWESREHPDPSGFQPGTQRFVCHASQVCTLASRNSLNVFIYIYIFGYLNMYLYK